MCNFQYLFCLAVHRVQCALCMSIISPIKSQQLCIDTLRKLLIFVWSKNPSPWFWGMGKIWPWKEGVHFVKMSFIDIIWKGKICKIAACIRKRSSESFNWNGLFFSWTVSSLWPETFFCKFLLQMVSEIYTSLDILRLKAHFF